MKIAIDADLRKTIPEEWHKMLLYLREVPGHGLCAVQRFIYTCGLITHVEFGKFVPTIDYSRRYCYPNPFEAIAMLMVWDGAGDPDGEWIKEKVSGRLRVPRDEDEARER